MCLFLPLFPVALLLTTTCVFFLAASSFTALHFSPPSLKQQGAAYASGAKQRIIKMQDMPVSEACLLGWWWMKESTGGRVSLVQKFFCWWLSQGLSWLPL